MRELVPKKFFWEEHHYFGFTYLVELVDSGISLQRSTSCIPFEAVPYCVITPSEQQWGQFFNSLRNLNVSPRKPEHEICDGFDVECHIKFRGLNLKFEIVNPDFDGFEETRDLMNQLTVCDEFPLGIFESRED